MPVIGFLNSLSSAESSNVVAAFRQGVAQAGFVEGEVVLSPAGWRNPSAVKNIWGLVE